MSILFLYALERNHYAQIRPIWLTVQTGSTITYYLTSDISDTYYLYCDKNPPSYNWNLNENTWYDC